MVESSADRDPIERLADSFLERFRAGERPSIESLATRYPDLADEIRELLPALIELELNLAPEVSATRSTTGQLGQGSRELPRLLGDYLILREVGRGGMGVVYEATQQSLGRHVALKVVLAASLAGSSRLQRFRLEARAAARLHHTNIVPVFGVGEQDGVHYYAMQFIRGQGLDAVVEELKRLGARGHAAKPGNPLVVPTIDMSGSPSTYDITVNLLSGRFAKALTGNGSTAEGTEPTGTVPGTVKSPGPDLARGEGPVGSELSADSTDCRFYRGVAQVGLQVAEALAYAHAEGVLHRDIKPSNLLLDARGTVWVTDFGLAKSDEAGGLTQSGDVVGTLRYMAPERFDGWSDPRSDVYSLGATLYELLTLRPAFDEPSRVRLIERVLRDSPFPPRKIDRNIPRDLETIVLKAMAKTPQARYANAAALAEDLRLFLSDRPILARRARLPEHAARWCRRNPLAATLTVSLVLLLVAITIGSSVAAYRFRAQGYQLTEQRNHAAAEANRAVGLLKRAQEAERDQSRLLRESLLAQARAGRLSGQPGRRFDSLAAIARAAAIEPSAALRDEAIACLALPDVHPGRTWNGFAAGGYEMGFDDPFERYAQIEADGTICVRRVGDGRVLTRLPGVGPGHGNPIFSPDGRWLAVPRRDRGRLVVYNLETGNRGLDVPGDAVFVTAAWSPDSKRLATIRSDGLVFIYDATSWREVSRFSQDFRAHDLAYDSTGGRLAIASAAQREVRVVNADNGSVLWRFHHPSDVQGVAWHPGGRLLATACNDSFVRILDVTQKDNPVRLTMAGHLSTVIDVAFHPEGDLLASHGWDGMLQVWDVNTGKPVVSARADPGGRLRFSRDGHQLACGLRGSQIILWEVATGRECRVMRHQSAKRAGPWALSFSPDGRILASAGLEDVRLWDAARGRELAVVPSDNARSVAFMPGGEGMILANPWGADLWPMSPVLPRGGGEMMVGPPRKLFGFAGTKPDNAVQVVAGGRQLVALDTARGDILISTIERPGDVQRCPGNWSAIFLAASRDGQWAATGGRHVTPVRIWDLQAKSQVRELPITESRLAFSPDSRWLVVGAPSAFEFFETKTWKAGPRLERDQAHLPGPMAFSSEGRLLAVAHSDRDVRIVETETLAPVANLTAPDALLISSLAFSPDRRFLAVGTENRVIHLWDLRRIRHELAGLGIPMADTLGDQAASETDPDSEADDVPIRLRVESR